MHHFTRYWLPVIVYCTAIFVQSSYPSPDALPRFANSDKLLHFLAYGLLGALFCRAFNTLNRWRQRWDALLIIGVVCATAYGLSDEWHQSFVSERTWDTADLWADFVGSLAGSWIYLRILRQKLKGTAS
ncbi:MAG: VanZ family protein [Desulfobacteraceae bacterium]|jgi:VanZ family protein